MEFATIIDTRVLLEASLVALVAGVGVAFTFSLAILGTTQSAQASREGRPAVAAVFAASAVAGMTATVAAIVFGIVVMTS
ncbi:MAG: hypothetical protein M3383_04160 [Actinomycetota bacterium]|nr:hypothetical protein [Actinomycetota bacterium]